MIDTPSVSPFSGPYVCGIGMASALGMGTGAHVDALKEGKRVFRPLKELWGEGHAWDHVPAAWLEDRQIFLARRQGPASILALHLARQAVGDAGWGKNELRSAALVVGSSRGNSMGWLDSIPGRRKVKLLSVPQSLHSELASSITIELGMHGPYHVMSSGCAAGLDAVGMAAMLVNSGVVERALAVGLDVPLSPSVLDTYWASRMLAPGGINNPYGADADGMVIAEGGGAVAMSSHVEDIKEGVSYGRVMDYRANSDACSPLGMPENGEWLGRLMKESLKKLSGLDVPLTVCPHASGTRNNGIAERAALERVFGSSGRQLPDLRLMKPWTGHAIGGSGILELCLMLAFAVRGKLPPNLPGLESPLQGCVLSVRTDPSGERVLMKTASSMGGHNAVLALGVN